MNILYDYIYYAGAFGLIFIGIFTMMVKRNYIKVIIGLSILETGVNLFLISVGYISNGTAPIFSNPGIEAKNMVDPVPQALVLTAIVIGFGVTAVALSLIIRLYRHHHTLEIDEIKRLKW